MGTIVIVAIYFFSTIILSLVMGWKLALGAIFGALPLIFGAALLRERMEQSLLDVSSKPFACSAGFASECMQVLNDLARHGCRLLLLHEYNTTQFLVVFVAIVLSAQSTGAFLGHVSDTYLCLGLYNASSLYHKGLKPTSQFLSVALSPSPLESAVSSTGQNSLKRRA